MNDLDVLERFRADRPEPDDLWLRELRRELVSGAEGAPRKPGRSVPRASRSGVALVAAAVLLAVLILLGSVILPADGPAGPDPAVADVLRRFSRIAMRAPVEEPPQPGQYVYWQTESLSTYLFFPGPGLQTFAYQVPTVEERWYGLDGSGRTVSHVGRPTFLTQADWLAYEAFLGTDAAQQWGEFDWGKRYEDRYGPGELAQAFVAPDLPTDPEALHEELVRQEGLGGSNGDWGVFTWAVDFLAVGYMSPELRSAFYEVMSAIPGTELIGLVEDELGRPGIAIGYTRDGVRDEVVFDRKTGDILAIRTVNVEGDPGDAYDVGQDVCCGEFAWAGTEAGTVMYSSLYLSDGAIVGSTHDRPS